MKKKGICLLLLTGWFIATPLTASGKPEAAEIVIYTASSTTDIMTELANLFYIENNIQVLLNPASSGTLARQIEAGAPADLYLSANQSWMDYVLNFCPQSESTALLINHLVWISSSEEAEVDFQSDSPPDIRDVLSMGDPEHVPAGKYGKEALESLGWYERLLPFILPGADVRAALSVVEMGEAQWGIVYETDAKKSEKVFIAGLFPEETHSPIIYSLALLTPDRPEASEFYQFLKSPEAADVFIRYGFTPALP